MSTAVAVHPPSHSSPLRPRDSNKSSPRSPAALSQPVVAVDGVRRSHSSSAMRPARSDPSHSPPHDTPSASRTSAIAPARASHSPRGAQSSSQTNGDLTTSPNVPIIKKEQPSSPEIRSSGHQTPMSQSRHRPRKLDLSRGKNANIPAGAATVGARPSTTSRDSGALSALHDVAAACLSPGFQTHDPSVQQQLVRSMEMKEQQRQIIEARLHGKPGPEKSVLEGGPQTSGLPNVPISARRKGKPPGLSINAPPAHQFAGEPRVVRTAPLDQTFTGLRPGNSLSRQVLDRHPHPASRVAHVAHAPVAGPAGSANSLPPIAHVLQEGMASSSSRSGSGGQNPAPTTYSPAYGAPSPGYPPPPTSAGLPPPPPPPRSHPQAGPIAEPPSSLPPRQREFKSAEEAVHSLSGGREELLPKIVHYGGHQPPTPPSPRQGPAQHPSQGPPHADPRSGGARRRPRDEYERDYDERADADGRGDRRYFGWEEEHNRRAGPSGGAHGAPRYAPYAPPKDSPDAARRKKDEFMALCARAWDLLHS